MVEESHTSMSMLASFFTNQRLHYIFDYVKIKDLFFITKQKKVYAVYFVSRVDIHILN